MCVSHLLLLLFQLSAALCKSNTDWSPSVIDRLAKLKFNRKALVLWKRCADSPCPLRFVRFQEGEQTFSNSCVCIYVCMYLFVKMLQRFAYPVQYYNLLLYIISANKHLQRVVAQMSPTHKHHQNNTLLLVLHQLIDMRLPCPQSLSYCLTNLLQFFRPTSKQECHQQHCNTRHFCNTNIRFSRHAKLHALQAHYH